MNGPLTLGTAGHVDHGKSTLVRALTGTDPDRLPAERARGLSIELGYAVLELGSGTRLSIVDVPGHERFVRTMVAGATGIDLFLMVVAADDGVMPQTREHAAVLDALEVRHGLIAITKADLLDSEPALQEAAQLLPGVPAVACSGTTGEGLKQLRTTLDEVAATLPGRSSAPGPVVLHVDRAFTIRGAGTVITGTLWSGAVCTGDHLTLLPSGRVARVRTIQVHDRAVDEAAAGQRVALNLAGVHTDQVRHGDAVVGPDAAVAATTVLDARLALRNESHNQRVQVHHGTRDVPARIADLGDGYWQLRLEAPILAARGDKLVVRSIAPPDTLGGGIVADPVARRHGRAQAHRERVARHASAQASIETAAPPSPPPERAAPAPLGDAAYRVAQRLLAAGQEPPSAAELGDDVIELPALRAAGLALRIGRDRYAHPEALATVRTRLEAIGERDGSITVASLRDELRTSRKFAQPLLEYFDAARVTLRLPDDSRVLRHR